MNLLEHTLRGSLLFLAVWFLDRLLATRVSARARRAWWILVPLSFVLDIRMGNVPELPWSFTPVMNPLWRTWSGWVPAGWAETLARATNERLHQGTPAGPVHASIDTPAFASAVLATGAAIYLSVVVVRSLSAVRHWRRERLCTDPSLLAVLEDCKAEAGVTAPIGLVVSAAVPAPVILGWLRPRILVPADLAAGLSREQLRGVFFHELAHFRALDIPMNWLFTAVCALHWFNPFAHLAFRSWTHFCEEAADERAIGWLRQGSGYGYGETLLRVLRETSGRPLPRAALAIVESVSHLRKRIAMIKQHEHKLPRYHLTLAILVLLAMGFVLRPSHAEEAPVDPRSVASGVVQKWLERHRCRPVRAKLARGGALISKSAHVGCLDQGVGPGAHPAGPLRGAQTGFRRPPE